MPYRASAVDHPHFVFGTLLDPSDTETRNFLRKFQTTYPLGLYLNLAKAILLSVLTSCFGGSNMYAFGRLQLEIFFENFKPLIRWGFNGIWPRPSCLASFVCKGNIPHLAHHTPLYPDFFEKQKIFFQIKSSKNMNGNDPF